MSIEIGKKVLHSFDNGFHVYLMNVSFEAFLVGNQGWRIKLDSWYHIPKVFSDLSSLSMCISKWIMWIISKSHCDFFIYIFAIHSSSRHEKRCRMSVRLFCLFQCSRNQQWLVTNLWIFPISSLLAFRRRWRRLRLSTGCFCVVSTICAGVSISYHDISLFVHVCAMSEYHAGQQCRRKAFKTGGTNKGRICLPDRNVVR